ncbi:hypothetical protein C8R43DRAFT_957216 [Mycena crocata]|nr:hypothetical protein C8R43DRAFT_957216 [Mycena crocata]
MSRREVPLDLCWEIALYTNTDTRSVLLSLSRATFSILPPLLYRHISVGDGAGQLVKTLAARSSFASLVQSLEFRPSLCARIDDAPWALVLAQLNNLLSLNIAHHVPMELPFLAHISFRLTSFASVGLIIGPWAAFIAQQPAIEELRFGSDYLPLAPDPQQLPKLQMLKARGDDIAKFSTHRLVHVWFFGGWPHGRRPLHIRHLKRLSSSPAHLLTLRLSAPQMLMILDSAPSMLTTLEHLLLDEDRSWVKYTAEAGGVIVAAAAGLNARTPRLHTLTLVCTILTPRSSTKIGRNTGYVFAATLAVSHKAPSLRTFHFCADDSCSTWRNWGQPTQTVLDAPREEHASWKAEPEYPY